MSKKDDFLKGITRLVEQADEVGRMCSDETVGWSTNDFLAVDIHDKYMIWKCDAQAFLQDHDFMLDAKFLMVENTVPMLKGGIEYGDKNSEQSRGLIKAISLELEEKLKHLRELSYRESGKVISQKSAVGGIILYLSKKDGLYRILNGKKEEYKLNPKEQRYKIIDGLSAKSFKSSKVLARTVGTKPELLRIQIAGIRKEIQKKFHGVKGTDFICSSRGQGYRIGDRITLQKE